jgi:uncharacterized protein (TIGR03118 family)
MNGRKAPTIVNPKSAQHFSFKEMNMKGRSGRTFLLAAILGLTLGILSSQALAQYSLTQLTTNNGKTKYTDSFLVNPWGMVYSPGGPFWVSDNGSGWSTLYSGTGDPQSLQVIVPKANGSGFGTPTGIAYNGSDEFQIDSWPSEFLYATLDGSIQGWSHFNPSSTLVAVDNSKANASYTGIAVTSKSSGNMLYAADTNNNKIDVYDGNFNFVKSFTDSKIPKGFTVFNVQDIGAQLYVSFAAANGGPGGYVDIFTEEGTLKKRLISGKPLNQPWGFALAPKSGFGPLSGTLLVGNDNNKTSTISGFDPTTGAFVATITGKNGKPIEIDQLWAIVFGGGTSANGKKNALYFTAGPDNSADGLFGVINFKGTK